MEYTIKIDDAGVNLIAAGIGKLPIEQAGGFWESFRNEIMRQRQAAEVAPTVTLVPEGGSEPIEGKVDQAPAAE